MSNGFPDVQVIEAPRLAWMLRPDRSAMTNALVRTVTRPSTIAALAASLLLVGIKLLFELYPGEFPGKGQAEAFTWPVVGAIILIGVLGLLAERALSADGRFPEPFTDRARE